MAWRIHDKVIRGEIDNRNKGTVDGRLWIVGSDEPLILQLKGNCWSDLAGCLFSFRNPSPSEEDNSVCLAPLQRGVVGDMTASRKVRVPAVSAERLQELVQRSEPIPTKLGNSIYLEWFSEANGRVVVEAAHYHCEISAPQWVMSPEQENDQRQQNQDNLQDFLQNLVNQQSFLDITEEDEDVEPEPLDEFEWERLLRKSDQITDQYLEALEKFRDDPECDRRVAEAMGWDWLLEEGDLPDDNPLYDFVREATGNDILAPGEDDDEEEEEEEDEEEDDEIAEEDEDEEDEIGMEHPLASRARDLACNLYRVAEQRGLLKSQDPTLLSLLTCTNATAAKLAGALSAVSPDGDTDFGFVVATLKRALTPLHQAIAAADRVGEMDPEETDWLSHARNELFFIRQDVLTLMNHFRSELNGGD